MNNQNYMHIRKWQKHKRKSSLAIWNTWTTHVMLRSSRQCPSLACELAHQNLNQFLVWVTHSPFAIATVNVHKHRGHNITWRVQREHRTRTPHASNWPFFFLHPTFYYIHPVNFLNFINTPTFYILSGFRIQ